MQTSQKSSSSSSNDDPINLHATTSSSSAAINVLSTTNDFRKLQRGIYESLKISDQNNNISNKLAKKDENCTKEHVFEKNEKVFYISKDGETKIEAKIVEVHTEDPEFINYTIKVGERELNTLPNNLSPISYNNTPPSTSSSFDSNFVDLQLYQYSGKDGKFSYKGSADFEKVRKDVSDNLDSHECNFSNEFETSEIDEDSQSEDGMDENEDDSDTKSVLSNMSESSYTSNYSSISDSSCTSNYSTKSAKARSKRSSDEEMKILASSATYVEVVSPCKCNAGSCATSNNLTVKQVDQFYFKIMFSFINQLCLNRLMI